MQARELGRRGGEREALDMGMDEDEDLKEVELDDGD